MILDILFLLPMIWFGWKGAKYGLVSEITSLAGLILGLYAAVYFSDKVAGELPVQGSYAGLLAFGITFLAVLIVAVLLGKVVEKLLDLCSLGMINKLLGGLFGILKVVLVFSTLIFFLNSLDKYEKIVKPALKQQSMLYGYLQPIVPTLYSRLDQGDEKAEMLPPPSGKGADS